MDEQEKIAAFPEIPSDERIQQSIKRYRERVSSPAVDCAVCAVCAQRFNKIRGKMSTFALKEDPSNDVSTIGPQLLRFMQERLRHNPRNPRQLRFDLPQGNICGVQAIL